MDARDEEKRLILENKKLAREVKRLNQDIGFLREAIEQSARTQAYIQRESDRQVFFVEQLMRTAPNILILTDEQMSTVITSDLFLQYNSTYDKKELQHGVPLRDALTGVLPESELDGLIEKCRSALSGRNVRSYVMRGLGMNGQQRWRVNIRRMSRGDEVVGLNLMFTDTTEILNALERAEAADKAKSNFLAKMSHEIRTPLNAILGLNEVILRDSAEPDTVACAADIQNAGKTLLSIINDILDFSKVEEGKMEILPTQYELGSVINDLVNMTRSRAEEKGLEFHVFVDETTPHLLYGDEIRIRQCALNLLTNAVKYTNAGSVTLTVGYDEVNTDMIRLKFTVADTGIGIKPEDMDGLTQPFARMEESRIRSIEGTGLGLAITKQLLDLMGGSLQVESIYGEGSEFSFAIVQPVVKWWPLGRFDGRYETNGARGEAGNKSLYAPEAQILVVDDMPVNLTVVKGLLKKTEIRVDTAESGAQAVKMASQKHYDMALIDHMMPEMDGIETLRRLKELPQAAETVCVALTANAISGSRERYIEVGFQDYLSKPVDSGKLREMLVKYLPPTKVILREEPPESAQKPVVFVTGGEEVRRQVADALGGGFRVENRSAGEDDALPEWLLRVEGLDVTQGLKNCGSKETYFDTLTVYARTAASNADELEEYQRVGDVENEITKVHALKSTSRIIGAEALGSFAERLELAGKAGDIDTLSGELDELLARYRELGRRLAPLIEDAKPCKELPVVSDERLRETYAKVRRLLDELEYDRAAAMLDSLNCGTLPEGERERFGKIRRAAEDFAWQQLAELLP